MSRLVDLTQEFFDGMPGFSFTQPDGTRVDCTAHIREALSHADTAAFYDGHCAFAYTEASFFTSIGTRLDAPYIRKCATARPCASTNWCCRVSWSMRGTAIRRPL